MLNIGIQFFGGRGGGGSGGARGGGRAGGSKAQIEALEKEVSELKSKMEKHSRTLENINRTPEYKLSPYDRHKKIVRASKLLRATQQGYYSKLEELKKAREG